MSNQVVVLISGGIDSTACASFLLRHGDAVTGFFIDYGQKAAFQEKQAAAQLSSFLNIPLQVVTMNPLPSLGTGELIGRNAFLVFTAMMACQLRRGTIALGIHSGTEYYDCTPAFLESASRLAAEYTDGQVQLVAPFIGWDKKQVFEYFETAGLPIELTYSCEAGQVPPCGTCLSCRDRRMLGC